MVQSWRDLLFLHWEVDPDVIQATLPPGLFVDTHDNRAFLGIVPFRMLGVRPTGFPPVPGLSNFLELNLRTYVYDRDGVPGVWFYSLDANQRLAVSIARGLFHLPYRYARMSFKQNPSGHIDYRSELRGASGALETSCFSWKAVRGLPAPGADSLEFFLVERYRLYAARGKRLWRGSVEHDPYPLQAVEVWRCDESLMISNGFPQVTRPPDHAVYAAGVDVKVRPLTLVNPV
jgi:uncharacterized protein YqjF (DUF2071 family)